MVDPLRFASPRVCPSYVMSLKNRSGTQSEAAAVSRVTMASKPRPFQALSTQLMRRLDEFERLVTSLDAILRRLSAKAPEIVRVSPSFGVGFRRTLLDHSSKTVSLDAETLSPL